jgi:alpha-galactosidase
MSGGAVVLGSGLLAAAPGPARPAPPAAPPMGWNSWNWHGKRDINERIVEETIRAMVATGLRDAGYIYVVIDGGWRDVKLGPNGELLPHPERFPGGIKRLADLAHANGLKLGLHTVPGTRDCGGDPVGGYGREAVHVRQFVDWQIDLVKLDRCRMEPGWTDELLQTTYTKWARLLAESGRDFIFSISAYEFRPWYPAISHMARTTGDIRARIHTGGAYFEDPTPQPRFLSVMSVAEINNRSAAAAGHGFWNDPDMLVIGAQGLTATEQEAHFALWCVMSAPLMLGNDPRAMTPEEKALALNRECIAIDQDPTEQGVRVSAEGGREIWVKRLADGGRAVLLLNRDRHDARPIRVTAAQLGWSESGTLQARDVFRHEPLRPARGALELEVPPHGCRLLRISR